MDPRKYPRKDRIFSKYNQLNVTLDGTDFIKFSHFLGDKRLALPSITTASDTSRCEAIEHTHLPRRQREDV